MKRGQSTLLAVLLLVGSLLILWLFVIFLSDADYDFFTDSDDFFVDLVNPGDGFLWDSSDEVVFMYSTVSNESISNCSLYVGGVLYDTDTYVTLNTLQTFKLELVDGDYDWHVECYDWVGELLVSDERGLTVSYDGSGSGGSSDDSSDDDSGSDSGDDSGGGGGGSDGGGSDDGGDEGNGEEEILGWSIVKQAGEDGVDYSVLKAPADDRIGSLSESYVMLSCMHALSSWMITNVAQAEKSSWEEQDYDEDPYRKGAIRRFLDDPNGPPSNPSFSEIVDEFTWDIMLPNGYNSLGMKSDVWDKMPFIYLINEMPLTTSYNGYDSPQDIDDPGWRSLVEDEIKEVGEVYCKDNPLCIGIFLGNELWWNYYLEYGGDDGVASLAKKIDVDDTEIYFSKSGVPRDFEEGEFIRIDDEVIKIVQLVSERDDFESVAGDGSVGTELHYYWQEGDERVFDAMIGAPIFNVDKSVASVVSVVQQGDEYDIIWSEDSLDWEEGNVFVVTGGKMIVSRGEVDTHVNWPDAVETEAVSHDYGTLIFHDALYFGEEEWFYYHESYNTFLIGLVEEYVPAALIFSNKYAGSFLKRNYDWMTDDTFLDAFVLDVGFGVDVIGINDYMSNVVDVNTMVARHQLIDEAIQEVAGSRTVTTFLAETSYHANVQERELALEWWIGDGTEEDPNGEGFWRWELEENGGTQEIFYGGLRYTDDQYPQVDDTEERVEMTRLAVEGAERSGGLGYCWHAVFDHGPSNYPFTRYNNWGIYDPLRDILYEEFLEGVKEIHRDVIDAREENMGIEIWDPEEWEPEEI